MQNQAQTPAQAQHISLNLRKAIIQNALLSWNKTQQTQEVMDFRSTSRLNVVANTLSGNLLPMTSSQANVPSTLKIYLIVIWSIQTIYILACITGIFYVPREEALHKSTVNLVVCAEVLTLVTHLHRRKALLRSLIGKLNGLLAVDDPIQRRTIVEGTKPFERLLVCYTIAAVLSVVLWEAIPLAKIFQKSQFYYMDYCMPAVISRQPFSTGVFVLGVLLQMVGAGYVILKKTSLDIYTVHLVLLLTSQYRYTAAKLAIVFGAEKLEAAPREGVPPGSEALAKRELSLLIYHHGVLVEISLMLKELYTLNISFLYVNSVFRFCFLGFMFITTPEEYFEKCLTIVYTFGALVQLYILCLCIQQLLEASTNVTKDAFQEQWYGYNLSLQRTFATIVLANKMQCRLTIFSNLNLTLPSLMSILNQAYSTCLLFSKMK